ncbi:MAG: hypothetical protein JO168_23640 [Solirubrobacterales bacterium]|nr:hypothetical protein [Solirubrobacterales bacterium]MBV9714633.1 hypothetical protein [Solirubrobacterales bacterium]
MSPVTYQTIKLSKGKHTSPEDGACVMELASMLAGEQFSDHPASVCPVIGSFLRAYNDSVDDSRRQDLYAFASKVVGTRTSSEAQRARAERLLNWAVEMRQRRWTRYFLPPRLRTVGLHRQPPMDAVGTHAVHAIPRHTEETHAEALALIDELLTIGVPEPSAETAAPARTRRVDVTV